VDQVTADPRQAGHRDPTLVKELFDDGLVVERRHVASDVEREAFG
jgi:hypothetical protein